ncbi:tetratricopeptide repeat protein [Roseomonas sp. BN140053]|uniref:tetratricopeptide repeat protein n=1 Tax=Roseomonas sp. BN140053 TaxID=3391898 RepID=UPI0039EABA82
MSTAAEAVRAALPERIRDLLRQGDRDAAQAAWQHGAGALAEDFDALAAAAQAFAEAGEAAAAEPLFRMAAGLRPGASAGHLGLSAALRAQGRHAEALAVARQGRERVPEDASLAALVGHLLLEAGDPRAAVPHFRAALPGHPDPGWTRMGLSNALASQGRMPEAVTEARAALAAAPADAARLFWLGHLLRAVGDLAEAATLFRSVLAQEPGHAQAQEGLTAAEAALAGPRRHAGTATAAPAGAGLAEPAVLGPEDRARIARTLALVRSREPAIAHRGDPLPPWGPPTRRLGGLFRRLLRGG